MLISLSNEYMNYINAVSEHTPNQVSYLHLTPSIISKLSMMIHFESRNVKIKIIIYTWWWLQIEKS